MKGKFRMALLQVMIYIWDFQGNTIKNISFSVDEKDKIGIIGINGAGKSTLIKIHFRAGI